VDVTPGETFAYGTPQEVVSGQFFTSSSSSRHATYDLAADGRRFITTYNVASAKSTAILVLNWLEELRRPVGK
jgi:hypothetical protein